MSGEIKISFKLFMKLTWIFNRLDKIALPDDIREEFKTAHRELLEKRARIRNREAYGEIKQAQNEDEREFALSNYINTKKLSINL